MRGLSFNTIETVATDTLANFATSRRLTDFRLPPRAVPAAARAADRRTPLGFAPSPSTPAVEDGCSSVRPVDWSEVPGIMEACPVPPDHIVERTLTLCLNSLTS